MQTKRILHGVVSLLVVAASMALYMASGWAVQRNQVKAYVHGNCTDANVALYESFDEGGGNLTVPSGCAASGTVLTKNGAPAFGVNAPNGLGKAVTFNGTTDFFVSAANVGALNPGTSPMVVETWFKSNTPPPVEYDIASEFIDGAHPGWILFAAGTSLRFQVTDGVSACAANSNTNVFDGAWHYFRGTWNGTNAGTATLDGGTPGTCATAVGSITPTAAFGLGARASAAQKTNGSLADLRVTIGNSTNNLGFQQTLQTRDTTLAYAHGNCADANVALYESFDEQGGNLTVPSGCAASGTSFTKNGSPTFKQLAPNGLGYAVKFNGSTDGFGTAGDVGTLTPGTSSFVIEGWVYPTVNQGHDYVYFKQGATIATKGYSVTLQASGLQVNASDGATTCSAVQTAALGMWHYFRGTWNGTNICTISVDNLTPTSTTQAVGSINNTDAVGIGAKSNAASNWFTGSIADLRVTIGNSTNNLGNAFSTGKRDPALAYIHGNCTDANVAAYFSLDDLSGNLTVPSGCAASGTVLTANGTPTYQQTAPNGLGTSVSFGGASDFFKVAHQATLDPGSSDLVVEGWIQSKLTATGVGVIAGQGGFISNEGWILYANVGSIIWQVGDSGGAHVCSKTGASINDGNWHYIRATWVNSTHICGVAVDGNTAATATNASLASVSTVRAFAIGTGMNNSDASTSPFKGSIADLRVTIGNSTNNLTNGTTQGIRDAVAARPPQPTFRLNPAPVQYATQTHGDCTSDPNVALYESFDEGGGNLTVPVGCAAAGTVLTKNGSPTYSVAAPNGLGSAVIFNGSTDFFQSAAHVASMDFGTSPMVIEAWFKDPAGNFAGDIVSTNAGGVTAGFELVENVQQPQFKVADGTLSCLATNPGIGFGAWHLVRATWDGVSKCSIQVDNGTITTTTSVVNSSTSTNRLAVGSRGDGSTKFNGSIADLRITIGNNINQLPYNQGANAYVVPATQTPGNCTDPNVAAWLSMDNASGNLTVPSGCAASGTVLTKNGNPTYSIPGPFGLGTSIWFNGSTDYFSTAGSVSALDIPASTSATVEGWVYASVSGYLMSKIAPTGNSPGWQFGLVGQKVRFTIDDNAAGSCNAVGALTVTLNRWHYVRATWNGSTTCTVFLDGVQDTQTVVSALGDTTSTVAVEVGSRQGGQASLTGGIADLRVTIGNSTNNLGVQFPIGVATQTAGGLYGSQIPLTFTRATASTSYVNGAVQTVASGVPVLGNPTLDFTKSPIAGPWGLYGGSAMTFAFLNNDNGTFTAGNACWTITNNTTDLLTPWGTNTAVKGVSSGCVSSSPMINSQVSGVTSTVGGKFTCTFWTNGTSTFTPQIRITEATVTTQVTAANPTSPNQWVRSSASYTEAGAGHAMTCDISEPANGANVTMYVARPEAYAVGFAVPLDPAVAGSTVTVNIDQPRIVGAAPNFSNGGTAMGWMYLPSAITNWIGATNNNTGGSIIKFGVNGTTLVISVNGVGNLAFGTEPAPGSWHHYAYTVTSAANGCKAYLDGLVSGSAGTCPAFTGTNGSDWTISWDPGSNGNNSSFATGEESYTTVLTARQVCNVYNSEASSYGRSVVQCP